MKKRKKRSKTLSNEPKTPKKIGRPSIFSEIVAQKMVSLFEQGKTEDQVAKIIGVTTTTLRNWKSGKQAFLWSVNEAKLKADEMVEASLYHRAIGYSHPEEKVFCNQGVVTTHMTEKHYPPEPTAAIYWLNNRNPNKWKSKVTVFSDESEPIDVKLPDGTTETI